MHVLWLPSWFPTKFNSLNGIFFLEQAKALAQSELTLRLIYPDMRRLRDFKISTFLQNRFQFSLQKEENLEIFYLHSWNLYPKLMQKQMQAFTKASLQLFEQYIKKFGKPDIIHAQSTLWAGFAAKEISEKYAIPFVITEHFGDYLKGIALSPIETCWTTPKLKEVFLSASKVFSVSLALNDILKSYLPKEKTKFEVLPNGVDTHFFKPASQKPIEPFHWITVAQLVELKNISKLLKAFVNVCQKKPHSFLSIYGDGPLAKKLAQEIEALKLQNHVKLCGGKNRLEIRDALQKSHAFVLASELESFGIVYIEALATGLPVIATKRGGPNDFVRPFNGYLVDPENKEELAETMLSCQTNINSFDPKEISEDVKKRFSLDSFVLRHQEIYANIL